MNARISKIHNSMVNNIVTNLSIMGENVSKSNEKYFDFEWNGSKCRVFAHKAVGVKKDKIVFEYASDIKSNKQLGDFKSIFIDYENPLVFYAIDIDTLYKYIDKNLRGKNPTISITNTGDVLQNSGLCLSIGKIEFLNINGIKKYNMNSGTNDIVRQYEPLVNKLTNQFVSKVAISWNEVKSMAYEGLAIAINTYDSEKSSMNFTQFAAFAIRNNILTSLDNELRTVKMSAYNQKKAAEAGETSFSTVRIDYSVGCSDDDNRKPQEIKLGMFEDEKFSDGDVFDYLFTRLGDKFNERDCEIFYRTYGLNGFDDMTGVEISKLFGLSIASISVINKKIINYIKKDVELCEMLANLVR